MKIDPFDQPDPKIDEYLALLRRWELSPEQFRIRELTVKLFEVKMMDKGLSVYEVTPHQLKGFLYGLVARGASVDCLKRHWTVLREYFDFLVSQGCFHQNPVTDKTFPYWGAEKHRRRPSKARELRQADRRTPLRECPPADEE